LKSEKKRRKKEKIVKTFCEKSVSESGGDGCPIQFNSIQFMTVGDFFFWQSEDNSNQRKERKNTKE